MTIRVTQDDIGASRRADPDCCPIGRALSRAGINHLGVTGQSVMIPGKGRQVDFLLLPAEVVAWLLNFDKGEQVTPLSFQFCPVDEEQDQSRLVA